METIDLKGFVPSVKSARKWIADKPMILQRMKQVPQHLANYRRNVFTLFNT